LFKIKFILTKNLNKFQNIKLFKFQKRKQEKQKKAKKNREEAPCGPAQDESHVGGGN
jgi:hypothetical protein